MASIWHPLPGKRSPRMVPHSWVGSVRRGVFQVVGMLGIGIGLPCHSSEGTPYLRIELNSRTEIDAPTVTLGDVARISGADPERVSQLKRLPLAPTPRPGQRSAFTRGFLERRIRRQMPFVSMQVVWVGARACSVGRFRQLLPGSVLRECAEDALTQALDDAGIPGSPRVCQYPKDLLLPRGAVELRPRVPVDGVGSRRPPMTTSPRGVRQTVWVEVWVEQQRVRTIPVTFEMSGGEGNPFHPRDRRVDVVPNLDGGREPHLNSLDGTSTSVMPSRISQLHGDGGNTGSRVDLPPGPFQELPERSRDTRSTGAETWVTRGAQATLRVRQGRIVLESTVLVLQNGRIGESVQVKRPNTLGSLSATVVGPGVVEIRP